MAQALIAVLSCWKNERQIDAIRRTWAKDSVLPVKFFFGNGARRSPKPDEVFLDVDDGYRALPHKVRAMLLWAKNSGFSHVFKADDDTYVVPSRLQTSGFEKVDHVGQRSTNELGQIFIHGGSGYWLSRRAIDTVLKTTPNSLSEDFWVTDTLNRAGISSHHDDRYRFRVGPERWASVPRRSNDIISCAEFSPEEMGKAHQIYLNDKRDDFIDRMSSSDYLKYVKAQEHCKGNPSCRCIEQEGLSYRR